MRVFITKHAAERMQTRLGIKINAYEEIYMPNNFVKVLSTTSAGDTVDWYVNANSNERAVLVVDTKTKNLKTVMTDGDSVDFAYSKLAKINNKLQ